MLVAQTLRKRHPTERPAEKIRPVLQVYSELDVAYRILARSVVVCA